MLPLPCAALRSRLLQCRCCPPARHLCMQTSGALQHVQRPQPACHPCRRLAPCTTARALRIDARTVQPAANAQMRTRPQHVHLHRVDSLPSATVAAAPLAAAAAAPARLHQHAPPIARTVCARLCRAVLYGVTSSSVATTRAAARRRAILKAHLMLVLLRRLALSRRWC